MREENFLSSWLREDGKDKDEIIMEVGKETKEGQKEEERRGERREPNGESQKKMCRFLFCGGL